MKVSIQNKNPLPKPTAPWPPVLGQRVRVIAKPTPEHGSTTRWLVFYAPCCGHEGTVVGLSKRETHDAPEYLVKTTNTLSYLPLNWMEPL